jgi:signal recognition particle subunit SRP19
MCHYFLSLVRWICIYPAYIDSNKTRVAGRRVPKSRAVERPTCFEISDVLTAANFKVGLEPKFYPREQSNEEEARGRVRVQLKNEDGTLVNPAFPSRN